MRPDPRARGAGRRIVAAVLATMALVGGGAAGAAPVREIVLASESLAFCGDHLQADIDALLRRLEKAAGWKTASLAGRGFARQDEALAYLRKKRPAFAILPLHAFVVARSELGLAPIGRAIGLEGPDPAYWVVARKDKAVGYEHIEFHPGLRLAGDDLGDARWLADVIFETNLRLPPDKHFILLPVASPPEAIGAVSLGQADAALVYESEMRRHLGRMSEGGELVRVYSSSPMPPPPVVALGRSATAPDRKALGQALAAVCAGEGKAACERLGILRLEAGKAESYDALCAKYAYRHPLAAPARR